MRLNSLNVEASEHLTLSVSRAPHQIWGGWSSLNEAYHIPRVILLVNSDKVGDCNKYEPRNLSAGNALLTPFGLVFV